MWALSKYVFRPQSRESGLCGLDRSANIEGSVVKGFFLWVINVKYDIVSVI